MDEKFCHASSITNYEDLIIFDNTTKNTNNPNYFSITKPNKINKYIFDSNSSKNKSKTKKYYSGVTSTKNKNQNNKNNKNYLNDIKRRIFNDRKNKKKNNTNLKLDTNKHINHNKTTLELNDTYIGFSTFNVEGNNRPKKIFKSKTKPNFIKPENYKKNLTHNSSNFVMKNQNKNSTSFNNIFNKQNLNKKCRKNVSVNDLIISQDNVSNNKFLITEYSCKKDNDYFSNNEEIINDISFNEVSISNNFNNSFFFEEFNSLKKDFELFYTKKFIDGINHDLIDLEYNLALEKIFRLLFSYNFHVEKVFNENNSLKLTIKTILTKIKEMNKKLSKLKNKNEYFKLNSEYKYLIKENDLSFNKDIKFNKIQQIKLLNNIFENRVNRKLKLQKILKVIFKNKPYLFVNSNVKKNDINKNGNLKFKNNTSIELINMNLANNKDNTKIKNNNKSFINKINNKTIMASSKSEFLNTGVNKTNLKNNKNETGKCYYKTKFKLK